MSLSIWHYIVAASGFALLWGIARLATSLVRAIIHRLKA
jgi:hypothetical protein